MTAQERRHHLSGVARGLFLLSGYRATTTSSVAEAGGVSEALLIKHFGTKDALFRETIAEPVIRMLEDTVAANWQRVDEAPFDTVDDHMANLKQFGVGWASLIRDHGPLVIALLREANDFPDVVAQVGQMVSAVVERVAESLTALTGRPEYTDFDVHVATYAGLAAMAVAPLACSDVEAFIDRFVPMMMLGVLSPVGRRAAVASVGVEGG